MKGLNNFHGRDAVKNMLKEWQGDVVCLQETKLDCTNSTIVKNLWGSPFVDWAVLDAIHTARGILGHGTEGRKLIILWVDFLFLFC